MKKEHKQRFLYRRAGVRWAICILMENTNCWQQPRASSCLLWTAEQEGISYFRYKVSVGEQAQSVKVWEEEAAVAAFCTNCSIIGKYYYQHALLNFSLRPEVGVAIPLSFNCTGIALPFPLERGIGP